MLPFSSAVNGKFCMQAPGNQRIQVSAWLKDKDLKDSGFKDANFTSRAVLSDGNKYTKLSYPAYLENPVCPPAPTLYNLYS